MKELDQLKEQVFSLKNTGENLKEILCVVGGLPTMDGNGNNTFPEKLRVMEVLSDASNKMEEIAELINASSKIQVSGAKETTDGVFISITDAAVLKSLREASADYRKVNEQLSTVLGELVKMLDLDGSGVDAYLLHYVADAMETFRQLSDLVKDIKYTA